MTVRATHNEVKEQCDTGNTGQADYISPNAQIQGRDDAHCNKKYRD